MKFTISRMMMIGILSLAAPLALAATLDPPEKSKNEVYEISANWSELKKGRNTLVMKVVDAATQEVVSGAHVEIDYDMVDMEMNPPNTPVKETEPGLYEKAIVLGMNGNWKFNTMVHKETHDDHEKIVDIQK